MKDKMTVLEVYNEIYQWQPRIVPEEEDDIKERDNMANLKLTLLQVMALLEKTEEVNPTK